MFNPIFVFSFIECVPGFAAESSDDEPERSTKYFTTHEAVGHGIEVDVGRQIREYARNLGINSSLVVCDLTEDKGFSLLKLWVPHCGYREQWFKYFVNELEYGG